MAFRTRSTFAVVLVASSACTDIDSGVVELNWAFVDRDGDAIFPAGQFSFGSLDACDLPARSGSSDARIDLEVQLDICSASCGGDCDGDCRVMPAERPGCDTARATLTEVPASDDPYLFFLRAVVV